MKTACTFGAAAALLFGMSEAANAVDIFDIGTDDGTGAEFLVEPTPGATADPAYTFDVDADTNPDDFVRYLVGPDEAGTGDYQPNDFNPLTILYTTTCSLLPGTLATLTVGLANVRNDGTATPGGVAYSVTAGSGMVAISADPVDTGGTYDTPANVGLMNPGTLSLDQDTLGAPIEIEVTDGWWVEFDRVALAGDCVQDYVKISGTKELRNPGKSTDPLYAFSGAVGTLDDGADTLTGTILVNYRDLGPTSCEFTPTAIAYDGLGGATVDADYACTGGDKDGVVGTATLQLSARDESGCLDRKGRKDRGSIAVDADDDALDIAGTDGITGTENCLATGNVLIDDDTQG